MQIKEYQNYHETQKHTSDDFPFNIYPCSIPRDFIQVSLHWHNEMELVVIKKGTGLVSVNLHKKTVSSGDIVCVLPGQLHSIEQKEQEYMEYENILLQPSMLVSREQDLCASRYILPLISGKLSLEPFITPELVWYPEAIYCIHEIDQLSALRPEGYQLAVKGWLFQFLFILITNQKSRDSVSKIAANSLQKLKIILRYVETHYSESITIDQMAALTYYSKSHFMKFFKQHMGMGFTEYLNIYRLTMACGLLDSTEDTILDIAAQVGFDNPSYFNRLFKRKYQMTPKDYRFRYKL